MPGKGLILKRSYLHVSGLEKKPIGLDVSKTTSMDDPQVSDHIYADGKSRSTVGYLDPLPIKIRVPQVSPSGIEVLRGHSGKAAVYRPDAEFGVWDVVIGRVEFDQDPERVGGKFNVIITLNRQTDRG